MKPQGRSKDIISAKHRDNPNRLDRVDKLGCDTVWKCFKRSVWRNPDRPFLGVRRKMQKVFMGLPNHDKNETYLGEYEWKTWSEIDDYVESLSRSLIKRNFCPVVKSEVQGTPDLKFLGIFAENRPEWIVSELAAVADSVCIVPVAIQNQFLSEERISKILNDTELETICVSRQTIGVILDLKSKDKLRKLNNIIIFDQPDEIHITLATQVGIELFPFHDLIAEGMKLMDYTK